jgi:hypothetical protein
MVMYTVEILEGIHYDLYFWYMYIIHIIFSVEQMRACDPISLMIKMTHDETQNEEENLIPVGNGGKWQTSVRVGEQERDTENKPPIEEELERQTGEPEQVLTPDESPRKHYFPSDLGIVWCEISQFVVIF